MRVVSARGVDDEVREPVLSPVDRVSELLFGLFMALSFVGAVSVAESGRGSALAPIRAALAIFLPVVVSTFPVVLPFALFDDVTIAKHVSRVIALVMLFVGGLALGRYAGYGSWKAGFLMVGLGVLLVGAIRVLGG